jgi:hypothetical protein
MDTGNTKKISGLDVYLSAVYYYPKEGQVSQAKVSLGSQKLTFENGDELLVGTNTYVDETAVVVTGTSGQGVTAFTIATPAQDAESDDIQIGNAYTDTATITFTDYASDTEKTIGFAYDNDTASATVSPYLMDSSAHEFIIREGDKAMYKDFLVLDYADDTHLLQLDNMPAGRIKTTDTLRFTDQFSGTIYEHTFTTSEIGSTHATAGCNSNAGANVSMRIGSQDYKVVVCNASTKSAGFVRVYWQDTNSLSTDAAADYGSAGSYTLFPQIKANNGEYIIFVNNYTFVPNGSTVVVPYQGATKTSSLVHNSTVTSAVARGFFPSGGPVNYTYDNQTANDASVNESNNVRVVPEPLKDYWSGIMILEEERADNKYYAVYIGITETGSTTKTVKVDTPTFCTATNGELNTRDGSGGVEFTTWGSDTYYSEAIDGWGTMVKYYSKDEAQTWITYPNTQLYADIYFLAEEAVTSTSATGTGTVKQSVPITWSVSLVDTDIQDPATVDYDLILVGGSCANSLVQKLVTDGKLDAKYTCAGGAPGEGWETGKGYIWLVEDAFKTGQTVLVVAGTEKAQTKTACSVVQKFGTLLADSTATAVEVTSATTAGITPL